MNKVGRYDPPFFYVLNRLSLKQDTPISVYATLNRP